MTRYVPLLILAVLASCEHDSEVGRDAASAAKCTVTATATPDTSARTITGKGEVSCDRAVSFAIEVCVQWNPSGTFVDIMCLTTTGAALSSSLTNPSSCGIGTGRMYRTRVNVEIEGTAKPEVLSSVVGCE